LSVTGQEVAALQLEVQLESMRMASIALSVAGSRHRRAAEPCQDASGWALGDRAGFAVVADGAGSASASDLGAQVAVETVLTLLPRWQRRRSPRSVADWLPLLRAVVRAARWAVDRAARDRDLALRELACTLVVAVALPTGLAIAQIGDGAVVIQDAQGNWQTLTQPEQGEFANETRFLQEPGAARSPQLVTWLGDWQSLALFSDGLQRLALQEPDQSPFQPFFQPLFRFLAQSEDLAVVIDRLRAFLESDRIAQRTDDDVTLILVQRLVD
jgi:serine/threonine protein phosphatase PrpC